MHPRSAAEFLLAGCSYSSKASAVANPSCSFASNLSPLRRLSHSRGFVRCFLSKVGKTLLIETAYPVPSRAQSQRKGPLFDDADTDGNTHVSEGLRTRVHPPADEEQPPKGKSRLQSYAICTRTSASEGKACRFGNTPLHGSAKPVTGTARPRRSTRQDVKGQWGGAANLSGDVHPRSEVHSDTMILHALVNAEQLATRPSHGWCGAAAFITRERMPPGACSSAAEVFPSSSNSVVMRIPRVSPQGYNTDTALQNVHAGANGVCALRRNISVACCPSLRSSSPFCNLHFLGRFYATGQPSTSMKGLHLTHARRHACQYDTAGFASPSFAHVVSLQAQVSQLVHTATGTESEPVSPICLSPATARSLRCNDLVVYSRRSHCWFSGANKGCGRHWWQTNECTAIPTVLRVAGAVSPCILTTTSEAPFSNLRGMRTGVREATEFCPSALPAAAARKPCVALRVASAAAPAVSRSTVAVAAGRAKGTSEGGELPQRRTFSSPAGRQFPEQDKRLVRPIRKLLIANRGEIAIRIHRACKEMGIRTVGVFSQADSLALHRQVCDESYKLNKVQSPVGAYLNYPEIIEIALKHKVDAVHPGYGFLSENAQFAAAVEEAGLMLVGPSPRVIALMGDKVQARLAAVRAGVQPVPGTNTPIRSFEDACAISEEIGFPVMLKAAYGGGGRGMRRVLSKNDLQGGFERAKSEAETAFGDGALFVEKLVQHGVHVEVQILADHYGDVVHLRERDCTVQRRHQKVVEIAPAPFLEEEIRERILADAVKLMRFVGYQNAGTVEFLVGPQPGQDAAVGARPLSRTSRASSHSNSARGRVEKGAEGAAGDTDDCGGAPGQTQKRRRAAVKALHGAPEDGREARGWEEGGRMQRDAETHERGGNAAYFIEVNPRLQVEHTVTEEVTGIDIVKTQIAIREGASLQELGVTQSRVDAACTSEGPFALQCRITTEDSQRNFQPSTGRIELYQPSTGPGIRLDGAIGASGAVVTPYYDSLLVKIVAKGGSFHEAVERARRALHETKIRGVTTNIPFILNVLQHPDFLSGRATTSFVDDNQMLLYYDPVDLSSQNVCKYLAQIAVNGPVTQLVRADAEPERKPVSPPPLPPAAVEAAAAIVSAGGSVTCPADDVDLQHLAAVSHGAPRRIRCKEVESPPHADIATDAEYMHEFRGESHFPLKRISHVTGARGLKTLLNELGPAGFVKALRKQKNVLLCDTTLRDAHQSLLATRLRTYDMVKAAPAYSYLFPMLFSLENWGGATFDVAYRFLRESPWRRLQLLREAIPNIPFQMLLRGANAVGYTAYADNVVEKFCAESVKYGIDIFRVFDSLNYVENLRHGIHAAGAAGGVVEAAMVYTGNVADPAKKPYTLEYYLELARQLVATDCHILCIKDMAGLLTPKATKLLVGSLRQEFPEVPIHVHTHDTAGCGVASMLAAAEAGADVVDVAIDALAGLTSQPPMGAIVSALQHTPLDPGIDLKAISVLSDYFERVRLCYAPFEATATLKSVSCDVYANEIPGGQYTNLHMQAFSLGLADQWPKIKAAYVAASRLLGNPPKVTPTSKVVGDLAQFMVQNNLDEAAVLAQADVLSFPSSVVQYFQGYLGQPPFGFPEPLRKKILGGKPTINGRPGATLQAVNWTEVRERLERTHGRKFREADLLSSVLYPEVFDEFQRFLKSYGDVSMLPTPNFLKGILPGESITVHLAGREVNIKYIAQTHVHPDGTRDVFFNVMGLPRAVNVSDTKAVKVVTSLKADPANPKHIGSPMPGNVLQVKVKRGQGVQKGQQIAIISAMKMETAVVAPVEGIVREVPVKAGDAVQQGDLLVELQ